MWVVQLNNTITTKKTFKIYQQTNWLFKKTQVIS